MASNNEFFPEEANEQDQLLIQQLRHAHRTTKEDAQSLACIRKRLLANNADFILSQKASISVTDSSRRRQEMLNSIPSPRRKERTWQQHISTLAAVLFITLVVGSLTLLLTHMHQSSTNSSPGTSYAPVIGQAGGWQSFSMLDAKTGWAVTDNTILRTTDGGMHWRNVSPPFAMSWGDTAFPTASSAWVLVGRTGNGSDGNEHLFRTIDGGRTWQDIRLNYKVPSDGSMILHMSALNAQDCWLYATTILHTMNGGKTWANVSISGATTSFYIRWMRFLSPSTGYVSAGNLMELYVTHDGGRTWQHQRLPLAANIPLDNVLLTPLHVFTANDAILSISISFTTNWQTVYYVTHDGGATWNAATPYLHYPPDATVFLDLNHWIVQEESFTLSSYGTIFHITSDGGQHWIILHPHSAFRNVYNLNFVSRTTGWALGNNINPRQSYPSGAFTGTLLKTVDGGQTWTQMNYTISG